MIVGLDLRLASPALRRRVTIAASRWCPATAPLLRRTQILTRSPLGAGAIDLWGLDLADHESYAVPPKETLGHRPEGVAPVQLELAWAIPEDMYRQATGWTWWVRYTGDVLVPSYRPPQPPSGSPIALVRAA